MGVSGVTVKLLDAGGATVGTQTTDTNGNYLFVNVTPGSYAVQVVAPAGYGFTTQDAGSNDNLDSDVNKTTGISAYTTLVSGENDLSWDAGIAPGCREVTFDFSGNDATCGTFGNVRSWTDSASGVTVGRARSARNRAPITGTRLMWAATVVAWA